MASYPRLSSPIGGAPRATGGGRARELLAPGLTGLIALAIALGVVREVHHPSILLTLAVMLAALGVVVLLVSTRYAVTLALIALYLGLLEGPVKLGSGGGSAASASRDVLIIAISLGAVARILARRERVKLPPLSGWVLAFVALTLVESFNPQTRGILKVLGGFRQQLEWMPFFFFGYLLMRSRERLRNLFILLGVIALANGVVGVYQSRLSPAQLSSWGPGYRELAEGGGAKGQGGRTYRSEGVARVRPPALGASSGFGGAVAVIALPAILALFLIVRWRRRWLIALLCLGAVAAVATSASRTSVIAAVVAVLAFAALSVYAGGRALRPLAALLVVAGLTVGVGAAIASTEGSGVFSRYASIASPEQATSTSVDTKGRTLNQIPSDISNAPFGVGLATVAAATGFGGVNKTVIEEHSVSAESQYNSVVLELGVVGLLLWIGLTVKLIVLVLRRLRQVEDLELRIDLAAVFAAVLALVIMGFSGPTTYTSPAGPFFWFAVGIAAYWLAGSRRRPAQRGRAGYEAIDPAISAGV
ncbi:MAG TPA: hypothetical protein VNY52_06270 [Solirubrobacteraceae bacterium]|jgi:hypothetical protein|nr:hypothetical protein [Solirubrobacteraceae bacterium]